MKYTLSALLICTIIFSCKKEEDPQPTKTELMTSQTWKYESGGYDADKNGTIDLSFSSGILPACILDNTATFQTNGTGVADEGATKCNISLPQTTNFTWSFSNNETKLNVTGSGLFGISGQFDIKELTDVKFTLTKDTSITGLPPNGALIVTLQH